jgi:hypothetical protein
MNIQILNENIFIFDLFKFLCLYFIINFIIIKNIRMITDIVRDQIINCSM